MLLVSSHSCLRSIHWSQLLSWEWRCRCSWSSADRRCSNYIWVINNFIAYWGATYIRGFTVGSRESNQWLGITQSELGCVNSLAPGRCGCNLELVIFKIMSRVDSLGHFLWNCPHLNGRRPHWLLVTLVQVLAWYCQAPSHYLGHAYVAISRH